MFSIKRIVMWNSIIEKHLNGVVYRHICESFIRQWLAIVSSHIAGRLFQSVS